MSDTQILSDETTMVDLFPFEETNDPNARAHVIWPPMNDHIVVKNGTAQDIIDIARASGIEVVALCGYKWVPKHNPEKHEACKACMDIWMKMEV